MVWFYLAYNVQNMEWFLFLTYVCIYNKLMVLVLLMHNLLSIFPHIVQMLGYFHLLLVHFLLLLEILQVLSVLLIFSCNVLVFDALLVCHLGHILWILLACNCFFLVFQYYLSLFCLLSVVFSNCLYYYVFIVTFFDWKTKPDRGMDGKFGRCRVN